MSEQNEPVLQTTRDYPCGCSASGPGDVPAYCSEHGVRPEVMQAARESMEKNAELLDKLAPEDGVSEQLQADLDAAVDNEPEIVQSIASVNKYKANVGGAIVWAQPVKALAYDKDLGHYLILSDGTKQLRPTLHGYNPAVGDYFVQSYKTTLLGDGRTYVEPVETAIVGKALFESLYTATE
jgi:hypothetical protein